MFFVLFEIAKNIFLVELLKNFITQINKTVSIDCFHKTEMDGGFIFNNYSFLKYFILTVFQIKFYL